MRENTVFILGAGASTPYGFPTSRELRKDIIENFTKKFSSTYKRKKKVDDFFYKGHIEEIKEFQKRFDLSSIFSIDYFISRNPRYLNLGKDAIIIHLLEYEKICKFRESSILKNSDWYSYLYNYMIADLRSSSSFSRITNNNFTFLTFNYERSLEYFLTESISYSFEGITESQLKEVMSNIDVIHIYGKISTLPYNKREEGLTLGEEISYDLLPKLRENIKTVGEEIPVDYGISEIISEAKRIFFLGFGYDKVNLRALGIPNCLNPNQRIYGTALGYNKKFIDDLKDFIVERNLHGQREKGVIKQTPILHDNLIFEEVDSLVLLKNHL